MGMRFSLPFDPGRSTRPCLTPPGPGGCAGRWAGQDSCREYEGPGWARGGWLARVGWVRLGLVVVDLEFGDLRYALDVVAADIEAEGGLGGGGEGDGDRVAAHGEGVVGSGDEGGP